MHGEHLLLPSVIETARLRLRPARESDAEALFKMLSDPRVLEFLWARPMTDISQALDRIPELNLPGSARYAIADQESDDFLGVVSVFAYVPSCRRAELGYVLDANHWGKGLMFEAASAVVDLCFTEANLNRFESESDPRNTASERLLRRLGFKEEGYMRERRILDGIVSDMRLFGLLKSEWQKG